MAKPKTLQAGTTTCQEMDALFRSDRMLDHVAMLDGRKPLGMITRQHFYLSTGGMFGYSVFQRKYAERLCKDDPLVVRNGLKVAGLAQLAMDRFRDSMYDPAIVIDSEGRFQGTVTVQQLLDRAVELEVKAAMSANPLTGLPGNMAIQKWLQKALASQRFTVVYTDLDRFKEYNDAYGFLNGDEMIRLTSTILRDHADTLAEECEVGHIGGDDFVLVSYSSVDDRFLASICEFFDRRKMQMFRLDDRKTGYFVSIDRRGADTVTPLTTLSLAVITRDNFEEVPHPAQLGEYVASLKKRVKKSTGELNRSCFMRDRRTYKSSGGGKAV
ncbi:diguanylate cyclase [Candidatus Fermentibacteria bacterium]|nr:diguanylate cyclase [Candidatus Fermentibacteria bacterium]